MILTNTKESFKSLIKSIDSSVYFKGEHFFSNYCILSQSLLSFSTILYQNNSNFLFCLSRFSVLTSCACILDLYNFDISNGVSTLVLFFSSFISSIALGLSLGGVLGIFIMLVGIVGIISIISSDADIIPSTIDLSGTNDPESYEISLFALLQSFVNSIAIILILSFNNH